MQEEAIKTTGIKNPITENSDFRIYSSNRLLHGYSSKKEKKNDEFDSNISHLCEKIGFVLPFNKEEDGKLILNGKGTLYFTHQMQAIGIAHLSSIATEEKPAEGLQLTGEFSVFMHYPTNETSPVFSKVDAIGQLFKKLTLEEWGNIVAIQPSPIGRLAFFGGTPVLEYSVRLYEKVNNN